MALPLPLLAAWGGVQKLNPKVILGGLLVLLLVFSHGCAYYKGGQNKLEKLEARSVAAYAKQLEADAKLAEASRLKNEKIETNFEKQKQEILDSIQGIPDHVQSNPSPADCVAPDDELRLLNDLISKTTEDSR